MSELIRRFEIAVLRPIQVVSIVVAVVMLMQRLWWWVGGCILAVFYVGLVGSRLHPLQGASDLARGPLQNSAATAESLLLSDGEKRNLVGRACTKVGILFGFVLSAVLAGGLGWRWYWAVPVACLGVVVSGGVLKAIFVPSGSL